MTASMPIRIPADYFERIQRHADAGARPFTNQVGIASALLDIATPEQIEQAIAVVNGKPTPKPASKTSPKPAR